MVVYGSSLRVVACRAECTCGRRSACQQFRFGGSEFDAGDGNPACEYGDSASQYRNPTGWNGHPASEFGHAANSAESEFSGVKLNRWDHADSRNWAGLELTRHSDSWKQHATFEGKSECSEQSGNNAQRSSLRSVTRNAGDARCLESKFRVEPRLLEFRFSNFAHNSGQQFG